MYTLQVSQNMNPHMKNSDALCLKATHIQQKGYTGSPVFLAHEILHVWVW